MALTQTEAEALNEKFEKSSPQEILQWAIRTYGPKVGLSSSFGAESAGLIHMAIQIEPKIPILFINTGFLFKETLQFVKDLEGKYKLNLREFSATPADIEMIKKRIEKRKDLSEPCCDETKIRLMEESLKGLDCWIAGLRRNQGNSRKNIKIVEFYGGGLLKVHPLSNWTSKDLFEYMQKNEVPYHPLWHQGYTSIGCEPCTQLPRPGEDERSGRWSGSDKTECGIHTFLKKEN